MKKNTQKNNDGGLCKGFPEEAREVDFVTDQCSKRGVDRIVAIMMCMPLDDVRLITDLFLVTVMHQVAEQGEIYIEGFGTLRLKEYEGLMPAVEELGRGTPTAKRTSRSIRKVEVRFKKASAFLRILQGRPRRKEL